MKNKKISSGLLCIGAALILILIGIISHFPLPYGLTAHSIVTGALCVLLAFYIIVHKSIHLIYLPLAALYLLFESQIASALGTDAPIINHFIVYVTVILLCVGTYNLLNGKLRSKGGSRFESDFLRKFNIGGNDSGSRVRYIDAAELGNTFLENNAGHLEVFIQNEDAYPGNLTVNLLNNAGNTVLHVPSSWNIVEKCFDNRHGLVEIRPNTSSGGKILYLSGSNNAGILHVVSP